MSAPKVVHGHNRHGLPVTGIAGLVEDILGQAAEQLPGVPHANAVKVARLDLVRDFHGVRDPSATLSAIAAHHVPYANVNTRYYRADGTLQTLVLGNKHYWRAQGYNKTYEQYVSAASPSAQNATEMAATAGQQLRFEVQLKTKGLRRHGLRSTRDLATTDLGELVRHYFERCNYDVNTATTSAADLFTLLEMEGLTAAQRRNVATYLFAEPFDLPPLLSRHTREDARAIVTRYRLSYESLGPVGVNRRLDFDLGRELSDGR